MVNRRMIDPRELDAKALENIQRQIGLMLIENIRMAAEIDLMRQHRAEAAVRKPAGKPVAK